MEPAEVRRFINPLSRLPNRMEEKVAHNSPLLRRVTDPFSNRPVVDNFQEAPAASRLSATGFNPQILRKRPYIQPMEVINPKILSESEESDRAWESCYSMPGYKALITRPATILARWQNRHGEVIECEMCDLAARVFLHELDHLDGIMFLDRMDSISDLHAQEKVILAREGEVK